MVEAPSTLNGSIPIEHALLSYRHLDGVNKKILVPIEITIAAMVSPPY